MQELTAAQKKSLEKSLKGMSEAGKLSVEIKVAWNSLLQLCITHSLSSWLLPCHPARSANMVGFTADVRVLSLQVDPEILGGLVVDIGDKHINMSVSARIQQLSNLLKTPIAM